MHSEGEVAERSAADGTLIRAMEAMGVATGSAPTVWLSPSPVTSLSGEGHPTTVYLDLNHWISLAKARTGHKDGARFADSYRFLQEHVASGDIIVPLSSTHYFELSTIKDPRQRADLADVMSELSRFCAITTQKELMHAEFDAAMHQRFGRPMFPRKPDVFGTGVNFAFGGTSGAGLVLTGLTEALVQWVAHEGGERVAQFRYRMNQLSEYLVLRGPDDEDIEEMRKTDNYRPGVALQIEAERLKREQHLAKALSDDPKTKNRLADIVAARELFWELREDLPALLYRAGMSVDSFFWHGKEWVTAFLNDMPCIMTQTALRSHNFKNSDKSWEVNDLRDIDALCVAVPYCDVVVTEKHAIDLLQRDHLDVRFDTVLLRRLADLPASLGH